MLSLVAAKCVRVCAKYCLVQPPAAGACKNERPRSVIAGFSGGLIGVNEREVKVIRPPNRSPHQEIRNVTLRALRYTPPHSEYPLGLL